MEQEIREGEPMNYILERRREGNGPSPMERTRPVSSRFAAGAAPRILSSRIEEISLRAACRGESGFRISDQKSASEDSGKQDF